MKISELAKKYKLNSDDIAFLYLMASCGASQEAIEKKAKELDEAHKDSCVPRNYTGD